MKPTRRNALALGLAACAGHPLLAAEPAFQLATFTAEVTVPLGHPLMGGGIAPAKKVEDPLFTHGIVLIGGDKPIVIASVDWCEIRNDAFDRWRTVLAEAAGTTPERVLVTSVHVHDAPVVDLEAQRILDKYKSAGKICDIDFHEQAVQRVGNAVRAAMKTTRRVTHLGVGQAKVEQVASNRRYMKLDGRPAFNRMSATRDPGIRAFPEGIVDPFLKTLSFWDDEQAVAALSAYATHPMSYYGHGEVSADFVGMARRRRQADEPKVLHVYCSGCSGNVTAGKYNDGSPENRPILADRMVAAMTAAWKTTERKPLTKLAFRSVPLRLEPRNHAGFTVDDLTKRLTTDPKPFGQCLAALGLSWHKRADAGHKLDVPVLDFGTAQMLLLPGEAYVEYQLLAQKQRPESFVFTMGYGECAPGYIPTDRHFEEGDGNLNDWCWVAPGAEKAMRGAIEMGLKKA
jgi:hypothetical protein